MRMLDTPTLVCVAALALAPASARAQDSTPTGGEPVVDIDPGTLSYDILVDGNLKADDPANNRFRTLQAAYAAAPEGSADNPTVIGIMPNVYVLPGTATGNSLDITKNYLTLLGLTNNRRSVVLADNRGNRQQDPGTDIPNGNGYVVNINATGFTARNLTFLNYCNVDYQYPGDASKNLTKRSAVITQAVALQSQGDKHVYENVALLSRLDTMFLRTTRSYFRNVFIEGTDDFIGGGTVSAWENAEIIFPTGGGVMAAGNVAFINSSFSAATGLQFSKGAGQGVALINVSMPAPPARIAWVADTAPPRPSQNYLTYQVKDTAGNPAVISDASNGTPTYEYSYELTAAQAGAFNPWNLLRATPTGVADDWDPAGVREQYESAGQGSLVFRIALTGSPASVRTNGPGATLGASVAPIRAADTSITWSTPSSSVVLSRTTGPDVVVTGNTTGEPEYVPVIATAANGLHATAWVYVEPPYVDAPTLTRGPTLGAPGEGKLTVDYGYELEGRQDQSLITWYSCDDAACASPREVAVSRDNQPLATYTLTPGDVGKFLRVGIQPKHNVSDPGPAVFALSTRAVEACDLTSSTVSPNFRNFVTTENTSFASGYWTVLGTWAAQAGAELVNGYGIRVGSQPASILYQEDAPRGDMQLSLTMTPEKTAGSGFGSPGGPEEGDRVQKSDIYIKYDPRTRTGYSLRYWRTTLSTQACMFQLYRIDAGVGTPLNDVQVLTGVFKPTTELVMKVIGDQLSVEAHNSDDAETLSLTGTITPNTFGGAGAAWYGTVSRGNSNVYSRFEISYPGLTSACPVAPGAAAPGAAAPGAGAGAQPTPGGGVGSMAGPAGSAAPSSDSGCAVGARTRGVAGVLGAIALLAVLAQRLGRKRAGRR
jgi:hypothetical protein